MIDDVTTLGEFWPFVEDVEGDEEGGKYGDEKQKADLVLQG